MQFLLLHRQSSSKIKLLRWTQLLIIIWTDVHTASHRSLYPRWQHLYCLDVARLKRTITEVSLFSWTPPYVKTTSLNSQKSHGIAAVKWRIELF